MGKANRIRANKAHEQVRSLNVKKQKKEMPGWLMTAIAVVITVAVLLTVALSLMSANGVFNRWTTVVSTDHYKVNMNMMSYYFHTQYQTFQSNYSTLLASSSLDTDASLKEQSVDSSNYYDMYLTGSFSGTWYDFFMTQAIESASNVLVYCEAALANDVELSDEDEDSIRATLDEMETAAVSYGYTLNSYLAAVYGEGVRKQDVRRALEYSALASKCATELGEELESAIDSVQINERYNADSDAFDVIDYSMYSVYTSYAEIKEKMFQNSESTDLTAEQKAKVLEEYEAKVEQMKAFAESLEQAKDADEFAKLVVQYAAEESFESKYEAALEKANEDAAANAEEGATDTDIDVPSDEDFAVIKQALLNEIVEAVLDGKIEMTDPAVELDEESESETVTAYGKTVSVDFAQVLNGVQTDVFDAVLADYEAIEQKKESKVEDDEFSAWAFEDGRRELDSKLIEEKPEEDAADENKIHTVSVYLLTQTKRKDTDLTHDVAYMLFDDQVLAKNAIVALLEKGEITLEMVQEYAEANGVSWAAGENYLPESVSGYGNLDEWLYEEGLTVGSITETPLLINSQYMVALYVEDGEEFWYETVKRTIFSEKSASLEEELKATYTVTVKEKAWDKIDA